MTKKSTKLVADKFYLIKDGNTTTKAKYIGRQKGFGCCVCGKGCYAHCFNIYYGDGEMDYETWGYGSEHLPEIIKEL